MEAVNAVLMFVYLLCAIGAFTVFIIKNVKKD